MAVVLVTGMSGTGKSVALAELARRGHRVVDTDAGGYAEQVPSPEDGGWEQLWREDRIEALLDQHRQGVLFLSGCVANQGKFYPRFGAVVLLSAPAEVILERVATRETNSFGNELVAARSDRYVIHLDVDVVDFTDAPLSEHPSRNTGLKLDEMLTALKILTSGPELVAITLTELNPHNAASDDGLLQRFAVSFADAIS